MLYIDRIRARSLTKLAAICVLAALAGCGGGADTVQNPVTSGGSAPATYTGPAPATGVPRPVSSTRPEMPESGSLRFRIVPGPGGSSISNRAGRSDPGG